MIAMPTFCRIFLLINVVIVVVILIVPELKKISAPFVKLGVATETLLERGSEEGVADLFYKQVAPTEIYLKILIKILPGHICL
jgi:hypothetical protein